MMEENCKHEWIDEYYGTKCNKCNLFYPYGCAPWDMEEDEYNEDDIEEWWDEFSDTFDDY